MKGFRNRWLVLELIVAIVLYFAMIPVRLAAVKNQVPNPHAIFVLGGGSDREEFAAEVARRHPELTVWVSSGSERERVIDIFEAVGVSMEQLRLDYRAVDTVTNFTTMVEVFQQRGIRHIYLLTSDFHMRRARAIAFFVLGSRAITYTPVKILCTSTETPTKCSTESTLHVSRDIARAIFWTFTNWTGRLPFTSKYQ